MHEEDLDDYESRQGAMGSRDLDDEEEKYVLERNPQILRPEYAGALSVVPLTLRFPSRCAGCGATMDVGEAAISQAQDARWATFHPAHATMQTKSKPVTSLEPGERLFELRYPQACERCHLPIRAGERVAGRKLDRGWAVRHPTCVGR